MISIIASSAPGLSPLARGTPDYLLFQSSHRRFIPAGAGNTIVFAPVSLSRSVYPRWRGEHVTVGVTLNCWNGLSPLARGTHVERVDSYIRRRFIPAGAGNTVAGQIPNLSSPVYPRWRGEHPAFGEYFPPESGLSPLARGTQQHSMTLWIVIRFIPAGAGNTLGSYCVRRQYAVYPRWRGEHADFKQARNPAFRFIPAGAGNTLSIHNCF